MVSLPANKEATTSPHLRLKGAASMVNNIPGGLELFGI